MATPTFVTIKKKDGSYQKVPLSDFKASAKKIDPIHKTSVPKPIEIKKTISSNVTIKPVAANTIPVSSFKPTAPLGSKPTAPSLEKEDFTSPLEEKLTEIKNTQTPRISEDRSAQVDEIIKNISFKINSSLLFRLRSVVQLRLKEIRSEEETKRTLLRRESEGGLQMNELQADEILRKCADLLLPQVYHDTVPFNQIQNTFSTKKNIPLNKDKENYPSASPVKTAILPESKKKFSLPIQEEESPVFNLNTSKTHNKPFVTDIMSKPLEVGPIEEVEYLTLTDFRRLAPNPTEAAERLGQKMINLKNESIILYLESIAAWKKSSLYLEYMNSVSKALAEKKKLSEVIIDKQSIQLAEINALVEMEKEVITI